MPFICFVNGILIDCDTQKSDPIPSVVSSLVSGGEGIRYGSIESQMPEHNDLNISDFLAHYRFPNHLEPPQVTHYSSHCQVHLL